MGFFRALYRAADLSDAARVHITESGVQVSLGPDRAGQWWQWEFRGLSAAGAQQMLAACAAFCPVRMTTSDGCVELFQAGDSEWLVRDDGETPRSFSWRHLAALDWHRRASKILPGRPVPPGGITEAPFDARLELAAWARDPRATFCLEPRTMSVAAGPAVARFAPGSAFTMSELAAAAVCHLPELTSLTITPVTVAGTGGVTVTPTTRDRAKLTLFAPGGCPIVDADVDLLLAAAVASDYAHHRDLRGVRESFDLPLTPVIEL